MSDQIADALVQANALLDAGDFGAATGLFSRVLAERPDSIDALMGQGECA